MPRPYKDATIDELFYEIVSDAKDANGLLDFALDLSGDSDDKIEVRAVRAFIQSVHERMANVVGALDPMIFELKARELEAKEGLCRH